MNSSRRSVLATIAGASLVGLAGCFHDDTAATLDSPVGEGDPDGTLEAPENPISERRDEEPPSIDGAPPVTKEVPALAFKLDTFNNEAISGGVGQDGIPSIDNPDFIGPENANLDDGDPVFGIVHDGVVRAYPQSILVWHEIVNDTLGDTPLAITYCPLTGTAQAFERGGAEFGVSGRLVNSNLIMYDRTTDGWWPQVLATGINGPLKGFQLREHRMVWTTWKRWLATHPDTEVLSENTGFARSYNVDPYGSYNPAGGYYTSSSTMFSPLVSDDREHPKEIVIGSRTIDGAIAFNKELLSDEQVLSGAIGDQPFTAVWEDSLATGYIYANPDGASVTPVEAGYELDGSEYQAAELPLDRSLGFDAMWFAWSGFYPHTQYVA